MLMGFSINGAIGIITAVAIMVGTGGCRQYHLQYVSQYGVERSTVYSSFRGKTSASPFMALLFLSVSIECRVRKL
jgi:hypothetical protein